MVKKQDISLFDIASIVNMILDKKLSREEGADWALKVRELGDLGNLEYNPKESEKLIWEGILFLEGIDLQDAPNSYLHNEEDIRLFLKKL